MPPRQFVLVSYDIPDDRRRLKVMKTLEAYGVRVQYSVFECWLTPAQLKRLRRALKRLVHAEDSIRLYFLRREDVQRTEVLGHGRVSDERAFYLV